MKSDNFLTAAGATFLSAILSSGAMAHPGHGETGWMHGHSALTIALTVVAATIIIGGLVVARMASRGEVTGLRAVSRRFGKK